MNWFKIKGGAELPTGKWRRVTPLLTVQGIHYRKGEATAFAKAALRLHGRAATFGLLVEPEPTNEHDPNALKVIGWGGGVSRHIGYVEAIEAARFAERYPNEQCAADFYSLYIGVHGFIDIRFFLCAPIGIQPRASSRVRSLLEYTKNELIVLCYAARADNKLGRFESEILNRYAHERARDFRISLVDQDIVDIKRWCREFSPNREEVEAAVHRIVDDSSFSTSQLWELVEIILGIDGKISKREKTVAGEISLYIREALSGPSD